MTKDEILTKAQKENTLGDEREQQIELEACRKGYNGALLMCSLMLLFTILLESRINLEFYLVYIWMQAFHYGHKAWKLRKKWDIAYAVLFIAASLICTCLFLHNMYKNSHHTLGW